MKKILFVGSECYPFVKTGGLGDVMSALPKALAKENCDVRVILPKYRCIPEQYKSQMQYVTHFYMDLGYAPEHEYVGIMTMQLDGITYYFVDNEKYFSYGNPYEDMSKDIVKYIYFDKAVLSALPVLDFLPDIIHCHDWQAGFVPVFLRTLFYDTELAGRAKTIMTIHNLKFQGIANADTVRYWTAFPEYVFQGEKAGYGKIDVNMLKGGLVFADKITTVSETYCDEIKTQEYGETLDSVINYHHMKLAGIVNGIDYEVYNPETDQCLSVNFNSSNVLEAKRANKLAMQEELGLERNEGKFVIGLISRLTDQKGLDILNQVMDRVLDENTQFVLIGTGEERYESLFRNYENYHRGQVCSNIMYSDARARRVYAGADAMLVPSRFEPCGLTQMMAFRYGALPIVRATGGLKDTVWPYNESDGTGTGFSFTEYSGEALLDTINYAKRIYFTQREAWNRLVVNGMGLDFSWEKSAAQYKALYVDMTGPDEEPVAEAAPVSVQPEAEQVEAAQPEAVVEAEPAKVEAEVEAAAEPAKVEEPVAEPVKVEAEVETAVDAVAEPAKAEVEAEPAKEEAAPAEEKAEAAKPAKKAAKKTPAKKATASAAKKKSKSTK